MMRHGITTLKTIASGISFLALSACATIDGQAPLANNIVADAIEINEAYNRTTNAVILKNILRARDRWPTNYTTLSGVNSSPSVNRNASLGLSPLGLGNASGPFQNSNASLGSTHNARKEYSVNPFADKDNSESILSKLKPSVAKQYFDTWPQDVVLMMFVGGVEYDDGKQKKVIRNNGDNGGQFVVELAKVFGVDPRRLDLKKHFELRSPTTGDPSCQSDTITIGSAVDTNKDVMGNFEKLKKNFGGNVSIDRGANHGSNALTIKACDAGKTGYILGLTQEAQKVLGASHPKRELDFDLRSFDGMVYYLGETVRSPGLTRVKSSCDDVNGHVIFGPIFDIRSSRDRDPVSYAASVKHNGDTYYAVPNASDADNQGFCVADRSATAIAILNQLLLLNQSSEFLKAPENFFN